MVERMLMLLVVVCLATGAASAPEDPFIGEWSLVPSKSRMPDEMKVERKGGNTYAFDFGGGVENIVVDGTDQPGLGGTLLSVKHEAPDTWVVRRKQGTRLLIDATWMLSRDGAKLTDHYRHFAADGSALSMEYVYQRRGGGSSFVGNWRSIRETITSPFVLEVTAFEGDGLSIADPLAQKTRNLKFENADHPRAEASKAPSGTSSFLRRVNARTLLITDEHDAKVTDTEEFALSADLKTLTMTVRVVGSDKADVFVFERAQRLVRRADVDSAGQLHIVFADRSVITPVKDTEQVAFDQAAVSPDGRTVGWVALYPNCCTTYPVPLTLVLLRADGGRTVIGDGLPIWHWAFAADSRSVVLRRAPVHGDAPVVNERRDVRSGRLLRKP